MRLFFLAALSALSLSAQVCGPNDISGPYGFQLYGTTTISGTELPMAAVGRLVFDGESQISGTSSVNFNGLFLGNPVTGSYELKTDCTLSWSLQDDSGGWQHFQAKVAPGGKRADFHQTDSGTGGRGILMKSDDGCTAASMRGAYRFSLTGISTPLAAKGAGAVLREDTITSADGNGRLTWTSGGAENSGTYEVGDDCFVELNFGVRLRGIVADGGAVVLAVQTDPEQVGVATFTRM